MSLIFPISSAGKRGGGFDPLPYNPVLWADYQDSSTIYDNAIGGNLISDGGLVGRVEDKSGNGNHLTQPVLNNRPTYTEASAAANGYASIAAPSSAGKIGFTFGSYTRVQLYLVIAYSDGLDASFNSYNHVVGGAASNSKPRVMGRLNTNDFFDNGFAPKIDGVVNYLNVLPMSLSVMRLRTTTLSLSDVTTLGYGNGNGGRSWHGVISEVIAFDYSLSAAEEDDLTSGLVNKYSIT